MSIDTATRTPSLRTLLPHVDFETVLQVLVRKLLGFEQYDPAATGGGRLGLVDFEDPALRYPAS